MALTSQQIMSQISTRGKMPNYKAEVAKAYDAPVLQPIIQERAGLEAQYLPAMFDPFTKMGTGAADMSPAAKMAMVGGSLGRLGSRIGANNSVLDFYGGQMGDIVGRMSDDWRMEGDNMWNMYNATYGQEEDARRASAAAANAMPALPDFASLFGAADAGIPAPTSQPAPFRGGVTPFAGTTSLAQKNYGTSKGLYQPNQTSRIFPGLTLGATSTTSPYSTKGGLTSTKPNNFRLTGNSLQAALNSMNLGR